MKQKMRKGFAVMSKEKQRRIAGLGGTAAHRNGTAHKWTSEEAKAAGKLGGGKRWRKRKAVNDPVEKF